MSTFITLPGLIDCHVHFREPGFPEKADMASESAAAVAGGVHAVCEMPNTKPATTSIEAFADKVERASRIKNCDLRFFFGVTEEAHLKELIKLWTEPMYSVLKMRCCGVKIYLDHSTGNQKAESSVVEKAFQVCGELDIPLVAHCEDPEINEAANKEITDTDISSHSLRRPAKSEAKAIGYAISLADQYNTPFHVAHLSTSVGVELVRQAKKDGLRVTCEVAPHHLFLSTDDYKELGTLGKMNPPLRTTDHCVELWRGIKDGTVDCISTDHAPHTLDEKEITEELRAPSGVPGVETMLPLLLTVAAGKWPNPKWQLTGIKLSYEDIERLCFTNPNRIFRLRKDGSDTIRINPNAEWIIKGVQLHSKCAWTPYENWQVVGKVV